MITTAGYKSTFGEQMSIRARQIKAGIIPSDYWHVVHYGAEPDDDPFDPDVWIKSNPAWGTLIKMENFLPKVEEAKSMPTSLSAFKRLNLNMWTGVNEDWIPSQAWDSCESLKLPESELLKITWYAGLDMSRSRDLSSFVMIGKYNGRVLLRAWHWVPQADMEIRVRIENNAYKQWADEGWITVTPGNTQDTEWITKDLLDLCTTYKVKCIGFDRAHASEIISKLVEEKMQCDPIGQGELSLAQPTKEFERYVVSGKLDHMDNPLMRWQLSNAQVERTRNGNNLLHKGKSRDRIDGIMASMNAIFEMLNDDGSMEGPPDGWMPTFV
jgi:phage terminase large subunit-like protein